MGQQPIALSRRAWMQGGAGLVIGLCVGPLGGRSRALAAPTAPFAPNAFVRIAPDSSVTVLIKHTELGQGPMTGLTTLVAEELDADWSQMRAEMAPANAKLYRNLRFGSLQGTGGSSALSNSYEQMRKAGAAARAMLVQAAAQDWRVPAERITVEKGVIQHAASGRTATFGQFVEQAAQLPVPSDVVLKDPASFRLIGREHMVQKLDVPSKTDGSALFTQDLHVPGMLTAVVARSPRFGGRLVSFDDTAARAVKGVVDVRQITRGVVVYATGTYAAIKGREALKLTWDDSAAETRSSAQIAADLSRLCKTPGAVAGNRGDAEAAIKAADRVIEREYVFPFLAHAPMETLDALLLWDGQSATVRYATQSQTLDQAQIAAALGLAPEKVAIDTLYAGGSFGRRSDRGGDMLSELTDAAKAIGPNRPLKLVWTREDDIRGGFYRPVMTHRMRGGVKDGKITGWSNTMAGPSFMANSPMAALVVKNGVDHTMVEGAADLPYAIADFRCEVHIAKVGVPVQAWRAVGHTHTAYAVECFIDELLTAAGQDLIEGRLALLSEQPRLRGVLQAVAAAAPLKAAPRGRARGVAVAEAMNSFVAQVAEVSIQKNGEPRVHKVWCAIDCGVAVNPDIVRAQMEGGIGYGLGHILFGQVPLDAGVPVPGNFDTYRSLRIAEMPAVEVIIIPSAEKPTGVGEPAVPMIGPAVANALAKLGRARPTTLPMVKA